MGPSQTPFRPGRRRALAGALAAGLLTLAAVVPTARAASLNPPPPAFESCHGGDSLTVCQGTRVLPGEQEPTGIICGSGASAFEIVDDSGLVRQEATRWYDAAGNLVRRDIHEVWLRSAWTNPLAGTAVAYRQAVTYQDVFAVPGDLATATETTTGVVTFIAPGLGAIVQNAGRTVIGFDGTVEFRSGPQAFIDLFVDGDASALAPLCEALTG
jgi:hypothetical protein